METLVFSVPKHRRWSTFLRDVGVARSAKEGKRLVDSGAVEIDGYVIACDDVTATENGITYKVKPQKRGIGGKS